MTSDERQEIVELCVKIKEACLWLIQKANYIESIARAEEKNHKGSFKDEFLKNIK